MPNVNAYVYPGDAAHLSAAIAAAPCPINPKTVRALEPYRGLTRALASASSNPAHAQEILRTVRPHVAALKVAYLSALAVLADVTDALCVDMDEVLAPDPTPGPAAPILSTVRAQAGLKELGGAGGED